MLLYVLFVQRKENYAGEHAPEATICMDEYSMEESHDEVWQPELDKLKDDKSVLKAEWLSFKVSQDEIRRRLIPQEVSLKAELIPLR